MSAIRLARRGFLGGLLSFPAFPALAGHGRITPALDLPDVSLTLQDGTVTRLPTLVRGHAVAIQLMLPVCTVTCPLGAATFAEVQTLLPADIRSRVLLVSIDVSPRGNPPEVLDGWLKRFHAQPGWLAAAPDPSALPALRAAFGTRTNPDDPHTNQIQIVGRNGKLVWQTYELPAAEDLVELLRHA